MRRSVPIASGDTVLGLPSWGRSFWQDPNDGNLVLLYASGNSEIDFVISSDDGDTWSTPEFLCPIDDFGTHNNFDSTMDRNGNIHCVHRYNDSGCYTILAKDFITGDWEPSGIIPRGFTDVLDAGVAKGVNASITVTDAEIGPFGDVSGPFPVARIVAKDSFDIVNGWWVPNPFDGFPLEDDMSSVTNLFPAGQAGGYPVFTRTGNLGRNVFYSVDSTGILRTDNVFGTWNYIGIFVDDPPSNFGVLTPEGSGYVSRAPLGPSMAFLESFPFVGPTGSASESSQVHTLICDNNNQNEQFEMLVAAIENQITGKPRDDSGASVADVLVRVDSKAVYASPISERRSRAPDGLTFKNIIPSVNKGYAGSSGTLVDMSIGNINNRINLYFLSNEPDGQQVISRMYADIRRDFSGGTVGGKQIDAQTNTIRMSNLANSISGIRSWAPAGREHTGGSGLLLTWNNFKALRHPVTWFLGTKKKDIVVTAGSGLDNQYRLVAWDYDNSIDNNFGFKLATFSAARTGIIDSVGGVTAGNAQNLIDEDTSTGADLEDSDFIKFDFGEQFRFDRFEVAWSQPSFGDPYLAIVLDASLDDTEYIRVVEIPEGHTLGSSGGNALLKASSELDVVDPDDTITHRINPFLARYVKVSVTGSPGTRDTREMRFYGAHTTAGKWVTSGFDRNFQLPKKINVGNIETFSTTQEGELPLNFSTRGDFNWFVRSSGSFSGGTQNGKINEPSVFQGQNNGSDDGFAVRTARTGIISGESGVLEATVNVDKTEMAHDGSAGRTIQFDMRYHIIGTSPSLNSNSEQDDKVFFETATPTGTQRVYYPGQFATTSSGLCYTNICNYFTYRTTVPTGVSTLRWVYKRGTTPEPGIVNDEGAVWVDRVLGVNTFFFNSIAGFAKGRLPSTADFTGPSGIYGFMEKKFAEEVFAYIKSDTATIDTSVNAFMVPNAAITGSVNAYTVANLNKSVFGYAKGTIDKATSSVNAFMVTSGAFASVLGHMQNKINEAVNGYLLAPSGAFSSINAYIITPEFSTINGYISGPKQKTFAVNAYLDSKGYQEFVNGYLFASGLPNSSVHGFLLNEGATSQVLGHISKGDSSAIAGYLEGAVAQTGAIYSWLEGIGHATSSINAYLASISGSISGAINSYTKGAELKNGTVYATTIGFGGDDQCDFPLSNVPSVTIPSNNFFV